jgi:hypothetical protein
MPRSTLLVAAAGLALAAAAPPASYNTVPRRVEGMVNVHIVPHSHDDVRQLVRGLAAAVSASLPPFRPRCRLFGLAAAFAGSRAAPSPRAARKQLTCAPRLSRSAGGVVEDGGS